MEASNVILDQCQVLDREDTSDHDNLVPALPGAGCEVFSFKDEQIVHSTLPAGATYPYLLVNIGSGVSFFRVTDDQQRERITGSTLGGSALGGLLSLLTGVRSYEEMIELAEKGNNANVDKLIGDIYGMDYNRIGMKMTAVASTFCKAFSVEHREAAADSPPFSNADICHSLVFAVFNNIGQLSTLQCRIHGMKDIYFTGPYVRDSDFIIKTLCIAVRYYSQGEKEAHVMSEKSRPGETPAQL
ncbi:pantothenate kinase [Fusarium albosuccineum]|uniref:Pantothenate kinase n=1 Tax=Fusarium albosuccineum TaxID=1237068 RepID=A0A8H4PHA4_9HYPO|nr:pantothenate kinase [Fusarium albosuccineum]